MTAEQFVAICGALATLLGAVGALYVQIRAYRKDVNGRLEQLIEAAVDAAHKDGELNGRDFMHRLYSASQPPEPPRPPA